MKRVNHVYVGYKGFLTAVLPGMGAYALYHYWDEVRAIYAVNFGGPAFKLRGPPKPQKEKKKSASGGAAGSGSTTESSAGGAAEALRPLFAKYVIVGAGTAAFSAAKAIRERDSTARIILIGDEATGPYLRPPLSKELWHSDPSEVRDTLKFKDWGGKERELVYSPDEPFLSLAELDREAAELEEAAVKGEDSKNLAPGPGTALLTGNRAAKLDLAGKIVVLADGREVHYSKLLLATGGRPRTLSRVRDLMGHGLASTFRSVEDFKRLHELTEKKKKVVVLGGSFLGSELACSLAQRGVTVTQVFPESANMANAFPKYLAEWTTERVRKVGVDVRGGTTVKSFRVSSKGGNKVTLILSNDEEVEADHIVQAVGIDPNTELAEAAGLEVDAVRGGVVVNSELEARRDVWVAGDVCSFHDGVLGRRRVEHHDHAVASGRVAGDNMVGLRRLYTHQPMFWSDLGPDVGYEAIGEVDASLTTVGIWATASSKDTPAAREEAAVSEGEEEESSAHDQKSNADITDASHESEAEAGAEADAEQKTGGDEYGKGAVFYMRDDRVVGVLLWNIFDQVPKARRLIKDGRKWTDPNKLAAVFPVHDN